MVRVHSLACKRTALLTSPFVLLFSWSSLFATLIVRSPRRYLKMTHGNLPGVQRRVLSAIERIRRMASASDPQSSGALSSTTTVPSPPCAAEVEHPSSDAVPFQDPHPLRDEARLERGPSRPNETRLASPSSTLSPSSPLPRQMQLATNMSHSDNPVPQDDKAPSPIRSPSTSPESDDTGVASLLMLRRMSVQAGPSTRLAPLKASQSALTAPGSAVSSGSGKTTSLPSSHPYYRSNRVLASPYRSAGSEDAPHKSARQQMDLGRLVGGTSVKSASLPRAPASPQHFRPAASPSIHLSPYHERMPSPRILLPPPPFSPTARRISSAHHRSKSDLETSKLRFIPPPRRTAPAARHYIDPPSASSSRGGVDQHRQPIHRKAVPSPMTRQRSEELPMPSPIRESFIRTPVRDDSPPQRRRQVRLVSPESLVVKRSPPSDESGRYDLAWDVARKRTHQDMESGSRMLYPSPPNGRSRLIPSGGSLPSETRFRVPSEMHHSIPSTSPESSSSGPRLCFIPPPARPAAHAPQRQPRAVAPLPYRPSILPAIPGQKDKPKSSVLDALIQELQGDTIARDKEGAALAIEEVASSLGSLAKRLRAG